MQEGVVGTLENQRRQPCQKEEAEIPPQMTWLPGITIFQENTNLWTKSLCSLKILVTKSNKNS